MARTFDHPDVVFTMLAIYVLLAPAMFVTSVIFFLRRKVHPVRARGPILILCINGVCLSLLTFLCLEYLYPDGYPCSLAVAESPIHLMALALLYFMRLWRLWFQSRLSQAMAEQQTARRSRKAASHVDFAAKAKGQGHDRPKKPSDPEDRKGTRLAHKHSDPEDRKHKLSDPEDRRHKSSDPEDRGSPDPSPPAAARTLALRSASAPMGPQYPAHTGHVVSANDHVIVIHSRDGPPPSGSLARSSPDPDDADYKRMFHSEVELQLVAEEYKNKDLADDSGTEQQAVSEDEENYTSDSMAMPPSSPSLAGRDPRALRIREGSVRAVPPRNSPRVSRSDKHVFQLFSSDPDGGEQLWMVDDPDLAESAGFFVRNRWLNSNAVVCAFLVIASLLVIVVPWTVILDSDSFPPSRSDTVSCPFWAPTIYTIVIGILVVTAFSALAVHLRGVSESLLIVLEMKAVAAASVIALIVYVLSSFGATGGFHSKVFPIGSLASILIVVVVWVMATLLPLYRSFVQLPIPAVDAALLSSVTLYDVLADDKATELFTDHLRSEFSAENLVFWESVEDFRELMHDPELLGDFETQRELALQIYRACIEPGAPYEVNFPSAIVKSIQAALFTDSAPRMVTIHNNDPTALTPSPRRAPSPGLQRAPTSDELLMSRHMHQVPEAPRSPQHQNRERKGSTASQIGSSWVCGTTLPLFDASLFDEAQKCVFRLLNADSFIRFKTSEPFKHFLRERLRESALQEDQDHIAAFSPSVSRRASTRMRTQESTVTVTGSPSQTALRHAAFTRLSSPSHSRNTASVAGAHESESKAQFTVGFALAASTSDPDENVPERSVSRSHTRSAADWNSRTFSARSRADSSRRELSLLYYAVPPALKPAGSPGSSPSMSRRNSQPGPLAQIPSLSLALPASPPDSNAPSASQTREPSPREHGLSTPQAPHHARGLSASTEDTHLPY